MVFFLVSVAWRITPLLGEDRLGSPPQFILSHEWCATLYLGDLPTMVINHLLYNWADLTQVGDSGYL